MEKRRRGNAESIIYIPSGGGGLKPDEESLISEKISTIPKARRNPARN